jgi:hypothetical protein
MLLYCHKFAITIFLCVRKGLPLLLQFVYGKCLEQGVEMASKKDCFLVVPYIVPLSMTQGYIFVGKKDPLIIKSSTLRTVDIILKALFSPATGNFLSLQLSGIKVNFISKGGWRRCCVLSSIRGRNDRPLLIVLPFTDNFEAIWNRVQHVDGDWQHIPEMAGKLSPEYLEQALSIFKLNYLL